jgi:hypothetical protein
MGEVLAASGRSADDGYLWAALKFMADRLPSSDPDSIAFRRVLRTRESIANVAETIAVGQVQATKDRRDDLAQLRLL